MWQSHHQLQDAPDVCLATQARVDMCTCVHVNNTLTFRHITKSLSAAGCTRCWLLMSAPSCRWWWLCKVISKCKNDKPWKNEIGKVPSPRPFKKTCPYNILLPYFIPFFRSSSPSKVGIKIYSTPFKRVGDKLCTPNGQVPYGLLSRSYFYWPNFW